MRPAIPPSAWLWRKSFDLLMSETSVAPPVDATSVDGRLPPEVDSGRPRGNNAYLRSRVHLRRYPYPYRAALAISNDIDGMDWASFEDWHAFVSGTGQTSYGQGLGLEVADSFWIWSDMAAFALRHAPPWDDPGTSSPEAERIRELADAGWLDSLHSFGDWHPDYHLTRDDITRGLDLLDQFGLSPPVYVNHGGGLRLHNLGGPWAAYQSGDDPDSESYHLQSLLERGFRFFWTDIMFENDTFGEEMTPGPTSKALRRAQKTRWSTVRERVTGSDQRPSRQTLTDASPETSERVASSLINRLLVPAIGRDGRPFLGFKRFRGREAPNAATFALQVSETHLDALEEAEGACVVYQHFGVWRALGRGKGHISADQPREPVLDDNAVWAFRDLHARQSEGRLFITTTSRLLNYIWVRDNLDYTASENESNLVITIAGVNCPVYGRSHLKADDLQGIAFLVESGWKSVTIQLKNENNTLQLACKSCMSRKGERVVFIPWRRLEYPDVGRRPHRSLVTMRVGGVPSAQDRVIVRRPLSAEQTEAFVDLVETVTGKKGNGVANHVDIERIVAEWQDLSFPSLLNEAAEYAKKMHRVPFSDYLDRLRRLTIGGGTILDAGSGTATWSFAMAGLFDRVIAVDKNRPRVDLSRWLIDYAGTNRIDVSCGDITDLDLPPESVDFIFCYGVAISYLSPRMVLREFHRVARPGSEIYVCVNGIGWSYHLRDDRGSHSAASRIQGQRGLYNTFCQTQQADANQRLSKLRACLAQGGGPAAAKALELPWPDLEAWLIELGNTKTMADVRSPLNRTTSVDPPDRPSGSKLGKVLSLLKADRPQPQSEPESETLSVCELAEIADKLLEANRLQDIPLASTLQDIERECGDDFVRDFGNDILNLLSGKRSGFSYTNAGRGYTPEEMEVICGEVGFVDFRWAGEGQLLGPSGLDNPVRTFFESEFNGHLGVWEFIAMKP